MKSVYYKGLVANAEFEIPETEVSNHVNYMKIFFNDQNEIIKSETYDNGILIMVDYNGEDSEKIQRIHTSEYAGVNYSIKRTILSLGDYQWSLQQFFDKKQQINRYIKLLIDNKNFELMQLEFDKNNKLTQIAKYYWKQDNLLYLFEYNANGELYSIYDLVNDDYVSFDDIKSEILDVQFYSYGYTFPKKIVDFEISMILK